MALELKNPFLEKTHSTVAITTSAPPLSPSEVVTEEQTYKVAVVGDDAVGKTSLLQRLCTNQFDTAYKPTEAIDLYKKSMMLPGGISVTLELTDVAGDALDSPILDKCIFGVDAVVFVYDITNLKSYHQLQKWIEAVQKICTEHQIQPKLAVIGNKMDLTHYRCVRPAEHTQLAQQHQMLPFLISARLGDLVTVVFRRVAAELAGVKLGKSDVEASSEVIPALIVDHLQNDPAQAPLVLPKKSTVCVIQ